MLDDPDFPPSWRELLDVEDPVGSGTSGLVSTFRVKCNHSMRVAVKRTLQHVVAAHEVKVRGHLGVHASSIIRFYAVEHGAGADTGFLAMEAAVADMWELCEELRLDFATILRFFREIIDALDSLHTAGFVHGDVKPSNILLTCSTGPLCPYFDDQSTLTAKLADLGHSCRPGQSDYDPLGCGAWQLYSRAFRAPELRRLDVDVDTPDELPGYFDLVGPPTDMFAVGVTLYFMVFGDMPRRLQGAIEDAYFEFDIQEDARFAEISEGVFGLDAGHPQRKVVDLLRGLLASDPAERWTSARVRLCLSYPNKRAGTGAGAEAVSGARGSLLDSFRQSHICPAASD